MPSQTVILAFGLTLLAGLSTGIGSGLALFAKRTNTRLLALSLGFSAGVMIYVSFVEIFSKAKEALTSELGESIGYGLTVLAFFGGLFLVALVDRLVPTFENPHEMRGVEEMRSFLRPGRTLSQPAVGSRPTHPEERREARATSLQPV